jgi:DNA polymerase-3 subunit delta'
MSWTVVGQDAAIKVLNNAVSNERVAHAYLFTGPAHVGKTLTAMQFAQLLNCTGEERPCGECKTCERITSGTHPDVETMSIGGLCADRDHGYDHSKDNSRDIRICQVRRIEEVISRAPFDGRYRVIVIEPADALNGGRTNPNETAPAVAALLKTLEEPPPYVVFVLVTDFEEMLPDTIRSRARRVAFAGQSREAIEMTLRTRFDMEPERATELARIAGGRLGLAIASLTDEKLVESREEALDRAEAVAQASLAERFAAASSLGGSYTRNRAATQATLELWQEWWRDLLLVVAARDTQVVNPGRLDTLRGLAAQCDVPRAVRALRAITDARQQLVENASPVLTLEGMMLALPVLKPNAVATRLQ